MELLDVIDEKGNVIGSKDRKEIYKDGDLHRTVHIWVINSNKELLVQKRSPKKDTYPNLWAISTAGHVKAGETSIKTALRELREELDIHAKAKDLELMFSLRRSEKNNGANINTIDDVYLIEADLDVEKTKLQVSELTDIKYVYYEYLEQMFKNNDPDYVPNCEENKLLFKYLHDKFDEHDTMGVLYKTESDYTYTDVSKLYEVTSRNSILYNTIGALAGFVILCNIVVYGSTKEIIALSMALILEIVYLEVLIFLPRYRINKDYDKNRIFKDMTFSYTFYEEYFNVKTKQMSLKVYYGDVYKVIETKDNFYLYTSLNNYLIVSKNNIETSFKSFLQNKITGIYKDYSNKK